MGTRFLCYNMHFPGEFIFYNFNLLPVKEPLLSMLPAGDALQSNIHSLRTCVCQQHVAVRKNITLTQFRRMDLPIPINLGESISSFRGSRSSFFFFISFFNENLLSKQNSPRWDRAFCGVTSWAILFVYVPQKGRQA